MINGFSKYIGGRFVGKYQKGLLSKINNKKSTIDYLKKEYELFFEEFPSGSILCDSSGVIVNKNFMVAKFVHKDVLSSASTLFELLSIEKSSFQMKYEDLLNEGQIVDFEMDLALNESEVTKSEVMVIPLMKRDSFIGMNVIIIDITQRARLLEKLMYLEDELKYSQRLLKTGTWSYDIFEKKLYGSDETHKIFEYPKKDFDNKKESFYALLDNECEGDAIEALEYALRGNAYEDQYQIVTPSGNKKFIHSIGEVIYDDSGTPAKLFGTVQDVTEQKLIEKDLRHLGDHLNHAQKVAGVGSYRYKFDSEKVNWSEEVYAIYGIKPQDFDKKVSSMLQHIHREDRTKVKEAIEQCRMGQSYAVEYRIKKADGQLKYVLSKGKPIFDEEQKVNGILGTLQDVTENRLLQKKLEKSNENLKEAQRLAKIGSWDFDILHNKNYWSEECYRIYDIKPEEHSNTFEGFMNFVHPADKDLIHSILVNPPEKQPFDMEFRIIRNNGDIRDVHQIVEMTFNEDREPVYIKGTIQDVTSQKELEKKMSAIRKKIDDMHTRFQMLVQDSDDIFEIIDTKGKIIYISPAVERVIGFPAEEIIGKSIFDFAEGTHKHTLKRMLDNVVENTVSSVKDSISTRTDKGKEIFVEVDMKNQLSEPSINGIVVNWRDITERVSSEKRIEYLANYDDLTELPNRVYLNKMIETECQSNTKRNASFGLVMLNIDGFKYINHSLGMKLGDSLIEKVVKRLQVHLGHNRLLFRYSVDQFGILVTDVCQVEKYRREAEDLINLFKDSFKVDIYELFITVSIGIATFPSDGEDADELMKKANIALLRAKESGKNKYEFYSPEMDVKNFKEFSLRNDLRKAIKRKQFSVHLQPIVNIQTGDILAAEALIRWNHPDWGMVSPDEFIYLAEETGFITELGFWVFKEVCYLYKDWMKDGIKPVSLSINFSSVQFYEQNIVENMKKVLDELQLEPGFLIIELTESVLINNVDQIITNIRNLQALGIKIAIDDFGTGFSSLAYLSSFNVNILKLDRSFIKGIPDSEVNEKITKAVVSLSRDLKIKLVAEGIENWEQLSFLRQIKCYAGQGYLYNKPVPVDEFEQLLIDGNCKPSAPETKEAIPKVDNRKYFRMTPPDFLKADMTILSINNKKVNVGNTKVIIKDIGPGGLSFFSTIRLPVKKDIILEFNTELLEEKITVSGFLNNVVEVEDSLNEYGVEFIIDEKSRERLTSVLNRFQVKIRKDKTLRGKNFTNKTLNQYFRIMG